MAMMASGATTDGIGNGKAIQIAIAISVVLEMMTPMRCFIGDCEEKRCMLISRTPHPSMVMAMTKGNRMKKYSRSM